MSRTPSSLIVATKGNDRLFFAIFCVSLAHALFVFGARFVANPPTPAPTPPSIEIAINRSSNEKIPDLTAYLGRSNSTGGSESVEERVRPSDWFIAITEQPDLGVAPIEREELNSNNRPLPLDDLLSVQVAEHRINTRIENEIDKEVEKMDSEPSQESLQIASLTQELRLIRKKLAEQSKELTLNSNTREFLAAGYIHNWIKKVERVGNINLPRQVRHLEGEVILEVKVDSQGNLLETQVLRSSGAAELDRAAIQSVKLSSPFKAFDYHLSNKVDILNIIRTWRFNKGRLEKIGSDIHRYR